MFTSENVENHSAVLSGGPSTLLSVRFQLLIVHRICPYAILTEAILWSITANKKDATIPGSQSLLVKLLFSSIATNFKAFLFVNLARHNRATLATVYCEWPKKLLLLLA